MTSRPPRVPFKRPLAVIANGERRELEALNLSRGGLSIKGELPRGTPVSLELGAGGRWLGFAEGEVVWCKRRGFGVRFTELRPNAQALVEHLVARGGTGERQRRRRAPAALAALLLMIGAAYLWHPRAKPRPQEPRPPEAIVLGAAPAMSVAALTAQAYPGEFRFQLPTGAVTELRVTVDDHQLSVTPGLHRGAVVTNVFTLPHPARLVIDVSGRQPKYSWQLEGSTVVKSVRVGARNHGTRVVVDLPEGKTGRVVTPTS